MLSTIKKIKKSKFVAGESRYCQSCGIESHKLFEVTHNIQKINQLYYCLKCKETYKAKDKVVYNNKIN